VTPVAAVVLAAGAGTRLRPLTELLPKALCPVGNVALLDRQLARLAGLGLTGADRVAVNAAYLGDQIVAHVGARAHLSVEPDGPLGTSGGIARLKDWIDGRGVLIGNADAYLADPAREPGKDIAALLDGWSGDTVRMLTKPRLPGATGGFSGRRFTGFSLLPWHYVRDLEQAQSDLVRTVWRPAEAADALELISYEGIYIDTGTPADYLAANLHAATTHTPSTPTPEFPQGAHNPLFAPGPRPSHNSLIDCSTEGPHAAHNSLIDPSSTEGPGTAHNSLIDPSAEITGAVHESVIGADARVRGTVTRSVVWPRAEVAADESLTSAIRAPGGLTVHV
jgi:NDP-sugar pyrophosphorylase family protein